MTNGEIPTAPTTWEDAPESRMPPKPHRIISRDEFRELDLRAQIGLLAHEPHRLADNVVHDQLWIWSILAQGIQCGLPEAS